MPSIDRIDEYIRQLKMIKNYKNMEMERDEALRKCEEVRHIRPEEIVSHIIQELAKRDPKSRNFTKQEREYNLPRKIDALIEKRVNARIDTEIRIDRYRRRQE